METDSCLLKSYQDAKLIDTARIQFAYTKFSTAFKLVKHLNTLHHSGHRLDIRGLESPAGTSNIAS